ncbi:MAG: Dabb family protein [Deltaproteobacteria bacterium]|nr:Dabb family protein [Deltaproteobacteria bacterium]
MDRLSTRLLRHVVLFKFKAGTTEEELRAVENAFCALPGKIDAIHDFEWGTAVSVEGKARGFTHCFVVTFKSEADRDAYLPHPAHEEFRSIMAPHIEKALVLDYWTRG